VPPHAPRHDHDAGGPADLLAAKAALRDQVWAAMSAARVARFPGAAGRIPNFVGAQAAAERLRGLPEWQGARRLKANPDSAQLPVRQRALQDGKTVYMAVPVITPDRVIDYRHRRGPRPAAAIRWAGLTEEKIAAIPLLAAQQPARR
jgi:5-formyltetrahydrofolate cyclo-ligase